MQGESSNPTPDTRSQGVFVPYSDREPAFVCRASVGLRSLARPDSEDVPSVTERSEVEREDLQS